MASTVYTLEQLAKHKNAHDGFLVAVHGKVYNVTEFKEKHPGGSSILTLFAGTDCTAAFNSYHIVRQPSQKVLEKYQCGVLDTYSPFPKEDKMLAEIKVRVAAYLQEHGLKSRDHWGTMLWAAVTLAAWCWGVCRLYTQPDPFTALLIGISGTHMGFIQHLGNHQGMCSDARLNSLAGLCMNIIGASSLSWQYQHMLGHHQYTNYASEGYDDITKWNQLNDPDTIAGFPLARFVPGDKWQPMHAWQHLYVWAIFPFFTLARSLLSDFEWLWTQWQYANITMQSKIGTLPYQLRFWGFKAMTILVYYLLPYLVHGWKGPVCWVLGHFVCGYYLAICFIVSHINDKVEFFDNEEQTLRGGKMTWSELQMRTCMNYSTGSQFWNIVTGGLNHQIEHHLFPAINIIYYPWLAHIVQEVVQENNVEYIEVPNIVDATVSTYRHLRLMGIQTVTKPS